MIIFKEDLSSQRFSKEDQHLKVIRPKKGNVLKLTDFKGNLVEIEVLHYDFKSGEGEYSILSSKFEPKPTPKVLIQSYIDKVYIEKLVEIIPITKVTDIVFVFADNSNESKFNEERILLILKRAC
ncbi:MAG: hypothetical protein ACRCXZ_00460, partial [Patescibacteria group bacterium]